MHDLGQALHHTGCDRPHTHRGDQLHRDLRPRVHLLEVVDELGDVLDRVDVVVGGRADQCDAGQRVAKPRDLRGHLVARKLASLARLGALRDLDL